MATCGNITRKHSAKVKFIAKNIMPGFEFPIGLLITIIGVPFFIYTSRRTDENTFNGG